MARAPAVGGPEAGDGGEAIGEGTGDGALQAFGRLDSDYVEDAGVLEEIVYVPVECLVAAAVAGDAGVEAAQRRADIGGVAPPECDFAALCPLNARGLGTL